MYLLDTNVVSELRKLRPHGAVVGWLRSIASEDLGISAMTIFELQRGAELTRKQDQQSAERLERWIDAVIRSYAILPLDPAVCRECARILVKRSDHLFNDAMIAATARVHHLTVVTRNVRDFKSFDVPILNPFASQI